MTERGLQAPNRAQNLRTYFWPDGVEIVPRLEATPDWKWGWQTFATGRPGTMEELKPASPFPTGSRVEYRRPNLTEWYENGSTGLEQGFTLGTAPPGDGPVWIDGRVTGGLQPVLVEDLRSIQYFGADGIERLRYADLHVEDAGGRRLPSRLLLAESHVRIEIEDRGAEYPIYVDPILTSPNWIVGGTQPGGHYGFSVATAGDVNADGYSDLIVGAHAYDLGQAGEGAAFLYLGSPTGPSADWAWRGQSDQTLAWYGASVAPAGDVNGDDYADVLVGAMYYDRGEQDEGCAFLYLGREDGLEQTAFWIGEIDAENAQFGRCVATAGDVNGDGYSDIVIGAPYHSSGDPDEGSAFLYLGSEVGPPAEPDWWTQGNQGSALYGISVATAGDVDADGYSDVLVGACFFDGAFSNSGRAYLFMGGDTGLSPTPAWTDDGEGANAWYGRSVSTAGDVNGDGYSDVIVGAPHHEEAQTLAGRAYVYMGSADGLGQSHAWMTEGESYSQHGSSVATAGDANGDGYADVLIGAPGYDGATGRASLYMGYWAGLSTTPHWVVDGQQAGCEYGICVATGGDVNADGYSDLLVGAWKYTNPVSEEGRAYLYLGAGDGPREMAGWVIESNQTDASFGSCVAPAGDIDADGYGDLLVGAWRYDNGHLNEGAIFLFKGGPLGLAILPSWYAESNQENGRMGLFVASAGDVNGDGLTDIIAGCPGYDASLPNDGAAFLWFGDPTGTPGNPTNADWTVTGTYENHSIADAVADAGDVNGDGYHDVVIGASVEGETYQGAAYLYLGSETGLSSAADWHVAGDTPYASLGISVATAGDFNGDGYSDVIVGADGYEDGENGEGAAFIYYGSSEGLPTTPSWNAQIDTPLAHLGWSVASAGDVNGDGFSDVIVGAPDYDVGGGDEGIALVWLGGSGDPPDGTIYNADWYRFGSSSGALFGFCVSSAGDVNGDGYSDILVGEPDGDHGEEDEGLAYFVFGSPTGLESLPTWRGEANRADSRYGDWVASAGDVNGDGFPDVIIGAPGFTNGQNNEGRAFLYYGNKSRGLARIPWQENLDNSRIAPLGKGTSSVAFRVQTLARSAAGRDHVRLIWEAKPRLIAFDGTGLGISPYLLDTGAPVPDIGSAVAIQGPVTNLLSGTPYRWRLRTVSPNPYFPGSPWITLAYNCATEIDMRTGGEASGLSIDPPTESLEGLANFPNPFTRSTEFRYALREDARVTLEIFDLRGRRVDIVVDQWRPAGPQRAFWDPSRRAVPLESGIYFARLTAGHMSITRKVHLTK